MNVQYYRCVNFLAVERDSTSDNWITSSLIHCSNKATSFFSPQGNGWRVGKLMASFHSCFAVLSSFWTWTSSFLMLFHYHSKRSFLWHCSNAYLDLPVLLTSSLVLFAAFTIHKKRSEGQIFQMYTIVFYHAQKQTSTSKYSVKETHQSSTLWWKCIAYISRSSPRY